ncbi:UNVERIFIED_ORG: hypothetical protein QFZ59_002184 [Bacillus sp. B2I3]|nr:hypothetical protein [Bacillus sp. B2I3]
MEINVQIVQAIKIDKLDSHRVCLQSAGFFQLDYISIREEGGTLHFSSLHHCKGKGGLPDFLDTFSLFIGTGHSYMQNKHVKNHI